MQVVLDFTDNEVQLFGALLKYTPQVKVVEEIEEEDGSIRIEESLVPNPYTLDQFVTGAVQAYVAKYKKDSIADYIKVIAKQTEKDLTDPKALDAIVTAVEHFGLAAIKDVLKSQL